MFAKGLKGQTLFVPFFMHLHVMNDVSLIVKGHAILGNFSTDQIKMVIEFTKYQNNGSKLHVEELK